MAAVQPPSYKCNSGHAAVTMALLLAFISCGLPGVQTQSAQNSGAQGQSASGDAHGLFNVFFIPAYRISTNRTLKTPPANAALLVRPGTPATNRPKTSTTEKPARISGAASDSLPGQQSAPPAANSPGAPSQLSSLPVRTQASPITQYLIGYTNGYQANAYQQQRQQLQQKPQYYPVPTGYYPYPTPSAPLNHYPSVVHNPISAYYPFPAVFIPPSVLPKSTAAPLLLPPLNSNAVRYSSAASSKDESVVKSSEIMVTPTLATAGPIYATAADEIQTTIEPFLKSTLLDSTVTASDGAGSTTLSSKQTTASVETTSPRKTTATPDGTSAKPPTSPSSTTTGSTSPSSTSERQSTPGLSKTESSSSGKAQEEEHRSISRHFEFSEDKEHSQVNATGDIRLTATRKTSSDSDNSQKSPAAAQPVPPAYPTLLPSLPLNTPHPHSHPHPAIIQGPNGLYIGSYNPSNNVGVIPPPSNFGGVPPNNFGGVPLNNFGGVPPNDFGGVPLNNFGGVPPNNFGVVPPNNFGGVPPNNFGGVPPNNVGAIPPPNNAGGNPPSNNAGVVSPPSNNAGAIPPPSNDPYNAYNSFGPSAALNQGGGFRLQSTLPPRYEDLYYGFAPGYPFGVSPGENNNSSRFENPPNNAAPGPAAPPGQPGQPAQQNLPPNTQLPVYQGPPRQFFDVAGPQPYPLPPQQVPYGGYNGQPFPTPEYSRFSGDVLQPPVGRPFYPGDEAPLPNRGYPGDPAGGGIPSRLFSSDPSVAPLPSGLYNPDPGPDALPYRGFGSGPPFFARSDSAEANSGLSSFASPGRGVGAAYDVNSRSDNTLDNYSRGLSREDSSEVGGSSRDY